LDNRDTNHLLHLNNCEVAHMSDDRSFENPIELEAKKVDSVRLHVKASFKQRVTMTHETAGTPPIVLSAQGNDTYDYSSEPKDGRWSVLHEAYRPGEGWVKGRGLKVGHTKAKFDDHPVAGDNSFDDAVVQFFYRPSDVPPVAED
jgi:hypothetical protein